MFGRLWYRGWRSDGMRGSLGETQLRERQRGDKSTSTGNT